MPHYYLFVDESGTADPVSRPNDTFLVLSGALIKRIDYVDAQRRLYDLKKAYWSHPDAVNIHAADIQRRRKDFRIFNGRLADLNLVSHQLVEYVKTTNFTLLNAAIMKENVVSPVAMGDYYHKALQFILERTVYNIQNTSNTSLTIFTEARGKAEDQRLKEFFKLCVAKGPGAVSASSFASVDPHLIVIDKSANITGLQLADLCAYTVRKYMQQSDYIGRDWIEVKEKIKKSPQGKMEGWGLKVYPP